jgi:YbbR domain-containing protein
MTGSPNMLGEEAAVRHEEAARDVHAGPRGLRTPQPARGEGRRQGPWLLDNLGLKFLSLVLAVFLWLVVMSEQKVDLTLNLPLEFRSIPRSLYLVNDVPSMVRVRLRGPKSLIQNLSPGEVALDESARGLVEGENILAIAPDAVLVPRGIEVAGVEPHRVRVVLEGSAEREIEVFARLDGAPASGFAVQHVVVTPARIWVAGPKSAVARLRRLPTTAIRLDEQKASFTAQAMLEPPGNQVRLLHETPITVSVEIARKPS